MVDLGVLEWKAGVRMKALRFALREATLQKARGLRPLVEKLITDAAEELPRFPSGLHSDFDAVIGGFVGLTVLAGEGGAGKSLSAIACALENVLQPETVVFYIDAENALGEQQRRAVHWFGTRQLFAEQMAAHAGVNFHWLEVLPGHTWEQIMSWCADRVGLEHARVLLVLDSVNALSRGHREKEFEVSSQIYMACNSLVRETKGQINVLALSELNGTGEVHGRQGVYHSTLAVKFTWEPDYGDDTVRLNMLKHRVGALQRNLGIYRIDNRHSRLVKMDREEVHHADA